METMTIERNLEEKTRAYVAGKPHIFFREINKDGKYIGIKIKDKKHVYHSSMEIINLLREMKEYKGHIHATANEVRVEYKPKYWKEIKKLLIDIRHVFGNGYHK